MCSCRLKLSMSVVDWRRNIILSVLSASIARHVTLIGRQQGPKLRRFNLSLVLTAATLLTCTQV